MPSRINVNSLVRISIVATDEYASFGTSGLTITVSEGSPVEETLELTDEPGFTSLRLISSDFQQPGCPACSRAVLFFALHFLDSPFPMH